jgi:hypothetical protein
LVVGSEEWVCKRCTKKGHTEECCPLLSSFIDIKNDEFAPKLFASTAPTIADETPLTEVIKIINHFAVPLDQHNPFRSQTGTLWALRRNAAVWKCIGAPPIHLTWLYAGYKLKFLRTPPMMGYENHPNAFKHAAFIDEELTKRVTKGQLSIVDERTAHIINPMEVVAKSSGGWRLIVDCRLVNAYLPDVFFRLENLAIIPSVVKKGDFLFSTDLSDAYYHIPIHESSRKYLCIRWRGVVYQYNVLPFGLNIAPWLFTKVLRSVITFCRRLGIAVVAYLDDFLWADDEKSIHSLVDFARALLKMLGFDVSDSKSEWKPSQILKFLGLLIDSREYSFIVPPDKLRKIQTLITTLLNRVEHNQKVSVRDVARVCGHLLSIRLAVPPARIYTRSLYSIINDSTSWSAAAMISENAVEELRFWKESLPLFNSKAVIRDDSTLHLFSDASDDGWGAHVNGKSAFGLFEKKACAPHTSSTYRELLALLSALRSPAISEHIRESRVTFVLDSTAAVFNLQKGGGPVRELSALVKDIWKECIAHTIDATAEWISRDKNEEADILSRFRDAADWSLNPALFQQLEGRWGPHSIDRFATQYNNHCKRFNARYFDSKAEAMDAFTQDWSKDNNYANPDWNDISKVIEHARKCKAQLTLVFPDWPSKEWHRVIRAEAKELIRFPSNPDTLIPGPRSARMPSIIAPPFLIMAARFDF